MTSTLTIIYHDTWDPVLFFSRENMANFTIEAPEIRKPNYSHVQKADRWVPRATILMVFSAVIVVMFFMKRWEFKLFAALWLVFFVAFSVFIYKVHKLDYRQTSRFNFKGWFGHQTDGTLTLVTWLLLMIIFTISAFDVPPFVLFVLTPTFLIPPVFFVLQKPASPNMLRSMGLIWIGTAVSIFLVSWVVSHKKLCLNGCLTPNGDLDYPVIAALMADIVWITFIGLFIFYVMRRFQLTQNKVYAEYRIILKLLEMEDPLTSAQDVLNLLYDHVDIGDRAFILHNDESTNTIRVAACVGTDAEIAQGEELPSDRGIGRRAIQEKMIQYAPDVTKDEDWYAGGLPRSGSELSVPILVNYEGEETAWGTINVQDNIVDAYSPERRETILLLANIMAAFGRQYPSNFDSRLTRLLKKFHEFSDPNFMGAEVSRVAKQLFSPGFSCYYRLTTGTGIPLQSFVSGDCQDADYFNSLEVIDLDSLLTKWIIQWEDHFIQIMEKDNDLREVETSFGRIFQEREGIKSMAVIPVGTVRARVGMLLLFFDNFHPFSRTMRMNLKGFAREISPHMAKAEYMASVYHGFAQPQLHLHSVLGQKALERGNWQGVLNEVQRLEVLPVELKEQIDLVENGLEKFFDEICSWVAARASSPEIWSSDLRQSLTVACGDLQERFQVSIIREIDPEIETLHPDLKVIIFSMVMEFVKNSLLHGITTTQIHIKLILHTDYIELIVIDDGVGFDARQAIDNHREKRRNKIRGGIFDLDELAQLTLRADRINWDGTEIGKGTRAVWKIPTLPQHCNLTLH